MMDFLKKKTKKQNPKPNLNLFKCCVIFPEVRGHRGWGEDIHSKLSFCSNFVKSADKKLFRMVLVLFPARLCAFHVINTLKSVKTYFRYKPLTC